MDERISEKLRQLAAVNPRLAEKAQRFYLASSAEERGDVEALLDAMLFEVLGKGYPKAVFLEPPAPGVCAGEYGVGSVIYPPGVTHAQFGLREDEWIRHALIVGMTGAGKTNLSFHLLRGLQARSKSFLVFDWKRNYRDLRQLPEFSGMRVFTVGRAVAPFRFNPLFPPPGTAPGQWLMKLVDVLKHAYFVGEGVEYLLRDAIDAVYEEAGFYDGQGGEPMFTEVKAHVARRHAFGRVSLWKASALRVLESLCFRHGLGPVVNTAVRWNHKGLLSSDVVLELDVLSDSDKVFFTEALILWLYELRKHQGGRERFKHALVIEEGHHVLSRHKEHAAGAETVIETCLRQIREFGEAVLVIDQEPSKLSESIKANTYAKIVFNLGNGKDIREIAASASLNDEERAAISLLATGEAIASLRGRINVPLHLKIPLVKLKKGAVKDQDISI